MNIILVDNDLPILRSLELILRQHGHAVIAFNDPRRALFHCVHHHDTEALIVDYSMPLMNGDELLKRLKNELPPHCRIILISAHSTLTEVLDLKALGVSTYLHKPIAYGALEHALIAS